MTYPSPALDPSNPSISPFPNAEAREEVSEAAQTISDEEEVPAMEEDDITVAVAEDDRHTQSSCP